MVRYTDGNFRFAAASYGSWAGDKVIVFRVREDTTKEDRAKVKGITCFDTLVYIPDDSPLVRLWEVSHNIEKLSN